jgi:hypothetical protein
MKISSFLVTIAVLSIALIAGGSAGASPDIVNERGSLLEKVSKQALEQFAQDTGRFKIPTIEDQKAWSGIVSYIANNKVNTAARLLSDSHFPFRLVRFKEASNGREYIVLEESPKNKGWGFYVFDLKTKNSLILEIPHPVSDSGTESQGIRAFLETRARAFILSGTHRKANPKESPCTQATEESDYAESDPAHNVNTMFHQTHVALVNARPDTVAVQLHGMRERDVCPNVFLSTGTPSVTKNALRFLSCLRDRGVEAKIYDGTVSCPLIASTNVQGRFSNGVKDNPCNTYATTSPDPGFFIHAEQEPSIRENEKSQDPVIEALKCAFPADGRRQSREVTAARRLTQK